LKYLRNPSIPAGHTYIAGIGNVLYGARSEAPSPRSRYDFGRKPMTVLALGLIPGLLLGWIAFRVADISATYPDIAARRGCRGGSCRVSK